MKPLHLNTPLLRAPAELFGANRLAWLKMDALQPSGSFKMRGVGHLIQHEVAAGARAIVCASGGNAGFTAALVGATLGVPVTIVVPTTTPAAVGEAIRSRGAQLVVHGANWDDAYAEACAIAPGLGAVNVHVFDHPLLWKGHASLIDEVVGAGGDFDCVVTSVGGGGLLAGIVEGLRRNGLAQVPVFGVETIGADSMHQSLAADALVTLPAITSIASSLGARRIAPRVLELAREHEIISLTVTDAQAVQACSRFAESVRVLVEPACGAALAALDVHAGRLARFKAPLVEVCGGIGVSIAKLTTWRQGLGLS